MTFNFHTLKHAATGISYCGPAWATSTFPFENGIYCLKQCVHSPKSVYQQMAKKTLQTNVFQYIVEEASEASVCIDYCK